MELKSGVSYGDSHGYGYSSGYGYGDGYAGYGDVAGGGFGGGSYRADELPAAYLLTIVSLPWVIANATLKARYA